MSWRGRHQERWQQARCKYPAINKDQWKFREMSSRYAHLEASGAPVDELDRLPGLDGGNRRLDLLRRHIAAVEQAARHVLALPRVTLHHLGARLEARQRHLRNSVLLVGSLVGRDEGREGGEGEVNTGEGD